MVTFYNHSKIEGTYSDRWQKKHNFSSLKGYELSAHKYTNRVCICTSYLITLHQLLYRAYVMLNVITLIIYEGNVSLPSGTIIFNSGSALLNCDSSINRNPFYILASSSLDSKCGVNFGLEGINK